MRYLARVRLGHAAQHLTAGQRTVSEIAHLCGYDDAAAFSKAFKRAFGQPPGAYRKLAHAAPAISVS
jgi:AraC-like DNA-binding protein